MCIACIEYTKDKLTFQEFGSALREMTHEDRKHAEEVARLVKEFSHQPDELKKKLKALSERDAKA